MFRPVSSTRRWSYINEELLRQSDLPRPAHLYACFFFFFNDTATTEIYTLSLHDALPILREHPVFWTCGIRYCLAVEAVSLVDRKSTRLNSSHSQISYAVFCLKKKKSAFKILYTVLVSVQLTFTRSASHHTSHRNYIVITA